MAWPPQWGIGTLAGAVGDLPQHSAAHYSVQPSRHKALGQPGVGQLFYR